MATVDQILAMLRQGQDQANQKNEERYQQILDQLGQQTQRDSELLNQAGGVYQDRIGDVLGLLQGMGETAKSDARRASAEARGAGDQSLMDRGLFNTTILDSQRRREGESLGRQLGAIDESVRGQQAGALSALTGDLGQFLTGRAGFERGATLDKTGAIERRTDMGPDMNAFASLLAQLGQAQQAVAGGRSFNFGGINRPSGPINPFGDAPGGGGGGSAGGGGAGGSGVQTFTNPGAGDPFSNQTIADLQATVQNRANQDGAGGLPVIPRHVWFQNPAYRIEGNFVIDAQTGERVGRKGN